VMALRDGLEDAAGRLAGGRGVLMLVR